MKTTVKDDGLLVFTYHHSRAEGWTSLAEAIFGAGFSVANTHPVKAEMSVAAPKSQAKEPIQLDVILVCKKREQDTRIPSNTSDALTNSAERARQKLRRLTSMGLQRFSFEWRYYLRLLPAYMLSFSYSSLHSDAKRCKTLSE